MKIYNIVLENGIELEVEGRRIEIDNISGALRIYDTLDHIVASFNLMNIAGFYIS